MDALNDVRVGIIRGLNDTFRRTFIGGQIAVTPGVGELPEATRGAVLNAVRTFKAFTDDNDPYSEHDFGAFTVAGERFNWKIDYYDQKLRYASPDPADPQKTLRVLTIMLASEY